MNEPDDRVSLKEWTKGLNEDTRERITALERHMVQLFEASQHAVIVASEAMTIRLDQLKEQALDFAVKIELEAVSARLAVVEQKGAALEGTQLGSKPVRDLAMVLAGAVLSYTATKLLT